MQTKVPMADNEEREEQPDSISGEGMEADKIRFPDNK